VRRVAVRPPGALRRAQLPQPPLSVPLSARAAPWRTHVLHLAPARLPPRQRAAQEHVEQRPRQRLLLVQQPVAQAHVAHQQTRQQLRAPPALPAQRVCQHALRARERDGVGERWNTWVGYWQRGAAATAGGSKHHSACARRCSRTHLHVRHGARLLHAQVARQARAQQRNGGRLRHGARLLQRVCAGGVGQEDGHHDMGMSEAVASGWRVARRAAGAARGRCGGAGGGPAMSPARSACSQAPRSGRCTRTRGCRVPSRPRRKRNGANRLQTIGAGGIPTPAADRQVVRGQRRARGARAQCLRRARAGWRWRRWRPPRQRAVGAGRPGGLGGARLTGTGRCRQVRQRRRRFGSRGARRATLGAHRNVDLLLGNADGLALGYKPAARLQRQLESKASVMQGPGDPIPARLSGGARGQASTLGAVGCAVEPKLAGEPDGCASVGGPLKLPRVATLCLIRWHPPALLKCSPFDWRLAFCTSSAVGVRRAYLCPFPTRPSVLGRHGCAPAPPWRWRRAWRRKAHPCGPAAHPGAAHVCRRVGPARPARSRHQPGGRRGAAAVARAARRRRGRRTPAAAAGRPRVSSGAYPGRARLGAGAERVSAAAPAPALLRGAVAAAGAGGAGALRGAETGAHPRGAGGAAPAQPAAARAGRRRRRARGVPAQPVSRHHRQQRQPPPPPPLAAPQSPSPPAQSPPPRQRKRGRAIEQPARSPGSSWRRPLTVH
jgi:hypothetical protein